MARLGTYYGLCPLIDQKSLLGVSEDKEKGVVIVTLGKNIAVKYRLSDQKQLHSWRTKEKFTSPVVFDSQLSRYIAVINQSYIRVWSDDEENIDKLKKYKFNQQIHTISSYKNQTFIIFKNGAIHLLYDVLEIRKQLQLEDFISDEENIEDFLISNFNDDIYLGLMVTTKLDNILIWTKYDGTTKNLKFEKITVNRDSFNLTGYFFNTDNQNMNFYTLWSDGKMFVYPLINNTQETKNMGELFTVVESLNSKHYISVVPLNQNYIAMYGNDSNEEGAVLVIYNTQFKMSQKKQTFKMFTKGAKLWCIENNLILAVGQHLAIVPFQLDTEQLAALVGSLKTTEIEDISIIQTLEEVNWDDNDLSNVIVPSELKKDISELIKQGLSESLILEKIFPQVLEQQDIVKIMEILSYFYDIPEKWLIKCMKLTLTVKSEVFGGKKNTWNKRVLPILPKRRVDLLNKILSKSFSEILILPVLRSILDLNDVIVLLEYICSSLSKQSSVLPNMTIIETEAKLIEWTCVLIDANYQRFLLTKDEKINQLFVNFSELIKNEIDSLEDLRQVGILLSELTKGKSIVKSKHIGSLKYSVEQIHLY